MNESPGAPSGRRPDAPQYEYKHRPSPRASKPVDLFYEPVEFSLDERDPSPNWPELVNNPPLGGWPVGINDDHNPDKWLRGAYHHRSDDDPLGGTSLGELAQRALHRVE